MRGRPRNAAPAALMLIGLAAGCSGGPSPLSPTPDQDPARHARAGREMEEMARRNRAAEARFYRRLAARPPADVAARDRRDTPEHP